jgi:hypothetical protein
VPGPLNAEPVDVHWYRRIVPSPRVVGQCEVRQPGNLATCLIQVGEIPPALIGRPGVPVRATRRDPVGRLGSGLPGVLPGHIPESTLAASGLGRAFGDRRGRGPRRVASARGDRPCSHRQSRGHGRRDHLEEAIDVCRRIAPSSALGAPSPLPSSEDMYLQALDEIRRRELAHELLHEVLDDRERRLFVACQLEARTRRSVGREEGISPQRVGQIVATAARKLQRAATSRSSREGGTL